MIIIGYWLLNNSSSLQVILLLMVRKNIVSKEKHSKAGILVRAIQFANGWDFLEVKMPLSQTMMDDVLV